MKSMKHLGMLLWALVLVLPAAATAAAPWIEESNRNAQILLDVMVRFNPEMAAQLGIEGHDDEIVDLRPQLYERQRAATEVALADLKSRLQAARDPAVRQDLSILIGSAEQNLETGRLNNQLLLPYFPAAQMVFIGVRGLLDPRVSKERQAAAIARLRRYAGLEPGYAPLAELAKARSTERFGEAYLAGPFKGQVEQSLADSPRMVEGLKALFAGSGLKGYEDALAALEPQLKDYDDWVRREIMPRARDDHRLPAALYADGLKRVGVNIAPEELIRRALLGYAEIRREMQSIAPLVAKAGGIKATDYRDVIRALKRKQVTGAAILPLYRDRLRKVEEIIRRERIVTLPAREAKIRLATEAESALVPAPFMSPPRLIGNTGEYGEFVLPLSVPGKAGRSDLRMDDFTFDAAAWTLTAHEARPGHELQFASLVEKGVSIARAVFAFNSVNIEGWGLYAEAETKPYLPLDGQLIGLQHRMMRAARAFLDPMVNLGQLKPEEVRDFLMREVVLSEAMAQQEVDRYTFRAPGQAASYFFGYQALVQIRQRAEVALRDRFDRQRFHDFVLAQGLLPPELLEKAVMEEFVPGEKARKS